jgi:microcystin-dependent protein
MAYTSDKKPGALTAATVLGNNDNVVVEQSGDVKRATLSQVEAKIFDAKTATSTPTGTEVTIVRLTDGNLRQVALSDIVPAGNITNAKVSASAAIADTKLATIATAGKVLNSATTATPDNDINAIVARDGSGNFSAGTITATLAGSITGNAATATTATTLATGRTIALTGDVTGTTGSFNGSANVSAATTIANDAVTAAKIADSNVTTAKIADSNVTTAKIANNAVTTAKIADSNVTTAKIADSNVTTAKIADSNVTNAKLASGIDASKLTTGTLPIARIADEGVTTSKLATATQQFLVPTGAIQAFAMGSAPSGWLACDGQEVSRSTYSALFAAIGTTWGSGNGSTTFNVPNLLDRFLRHAGPNYSGSVGTLQGFQNAAHTHTGTTSTDGSHTHVVDDTNTGFSSLSGGGSSFVTPQGTITRTTSSAGSHSHTFTTDSSGGTEARPLSATVLYCIKF